jgi:hypothetical protein
MNCPDDGGSTHYKNIGLLKRDYTALYPRRLSSPYGTPVFVLDRHMCMEQVVEEMFDAF